MKEGFNTKQKVKDTIRKYNLIENGDNLVLGISGGPDSLAMLYIINELQKEFQKEGISFDFSVAHINHMIREEASEDEEFVKNTCQNLGVKFFSKSIDVKQIAHTKKIGVEEAGRDSRYQYFDEIAKKINANKIAIAHNANDKAETIIMNILRGTGVSGLKGIEPIKDNKYIRPLLECTRKEIEEYCEQKKLQPRIDKTNFDNTYTRNKIRNVVIPYIQKEFNPNIIETLNRLSELVKEEENYLTKKVEEVYIQIVKQEKPHIVLDLKQFNNQETVIKSRLVLYTITKVLGNSQGISKVHIEDIIKLCKNNIGNKYLTPNQYIKIFVKSGQIHFIDQR